MDRETQVELLSEPDPNGLPKTVANRVRRLYELVSGGQIAPAHQLPGVLCDWWQRVRFMPGHEPGGGKDQPRSRCWLADYVPNKPQNGYFQARLLGGAFMAHVLSYLLSYRGIDPRCRCRIFAITACASGRNISCRYHGISFLPACCSSLLCFFFKVCLDSPSHILVCRRMPSSSCNDRVPGLCATWDAAHTGLGASDPDKQQRLGGGGGGCVRSFFLLLVMLCVF